MKRGRPKRVGDEYVRNGTRCIFLCTEAMTGWRHVDPQQHRTKLDWAHQICRLLETDYPDYQKIRLVMDNLNTHSISSLCEAFPPDIARSLAKRLEIHYMAKQGSYPSIAEIELSVVSKHCLYCRIDSITILGSKLALWETERNTMQKGVDW